MCRPTMVDDHHEGSPFFRPAPSLDIRAFYLRLSSAPAPAPAELTLVYVPAIGGAALALNGRALPPAAPAEVRLRRAAGGASSPAYASADRVSAADGARFEVFDGKARAAEGVFRCRPGGGWRVECRRATPPAAAAASVAEVAVLADGGVLMRDKARPSRRGMGCGATRLEGIPEEATDAGWGCDCGSCACGDEDWEVLDDDTWKDDEEVEMETVRWAMEMGVWAVCLGVGLLATARRFRRRRAFS